MACVTPDARVADCAYNTQNIIDAIRKACDKGVSLTVFPELSITGYTCGDLFLQQRLISAAYSSMLRVANETKDLPVASVIGLPVQYKGKLYNCAAVLSGGKVCGIVPKIYLPNYAEFYEMRHFESGLWLDREISGDAPDNAARHTIQIGKTSGADATRNGGPGSFEPGSFESVPFGSKLLFSNGEFTFAVEICEDLWTVIPPSSYHAQAGATILVNLSSGNELTGKARYRRDLVTNQSARCIAAYVYACAGEGESTTDLVFSGHNMVCENGRMLAESKRFENGMIIADIDNDYLIGERSRNTSFHANIQGYREAPVLYGGNQWPGQNERAEAVIGGPHDISNNCGHDPEPSSFCRESRPRILYRDVSPTPFVPHDETLRNIHCDEILALQAYGLKKRLMHVNPKTVVLGLSGGLDSTLALLVCARAFDLWRAPRERIICVTMPCFGTTDRTRENAKKLALNVGATLREIPIFDAVNQHFKDIGHDPAEHDLTYENSQARERTQVLMDIASETEGFVVGTGDLSELALGFATYNGDHMSMYGVNASIPKTLIRYLIAYAADTYDAPELGAVLKDVLNTPVSPELLPPKGGEIAQRTESILGPYEAHDFFLYYMMRLGYPPQKILYLAQIAFKDLYTKEQLTAWLTTFYKRFFSNQFKRSCLPDGAKVGSVALSPRGDWRMPSDAVVNCWLEEADL